MQSARVAVGMLALFPGLAAGTLWTRPPRGAYGLHLQYSFLWPLHGTMLLAIVAMVVAAFFGLAWRRPGAARRAPPESEALDLAAVKGEVRH